MFYTIGYEASDLDEVLGTLKSSGVTLLIDVREIAASRRKGFSKSALSSALANEEIGYLHLRALGDPKAGREAARKGYRAEFQRIYAGRLATDEAQQALAHVVELAQTETICLLCYEAEARDCHRAIVASNVTQTTRVPVEHLRPLKHARSDVHRAAPHPHQSRSASLN